jgi:predicted MFS family arabinose efflux permease
MGMKGATGWFRGRRILVPTYKANIPKLYILYALYNAMFFAPIWVIYLQQERGLSLFEVTLIDVSFWGTSLFISLPVGIIADSFGRKRSIAIALSAGIAGALLFIFASSFPLLLFANILFAVSFAFMFGAILSLFYDSLKQTGREGEYTQQRGWLSAVVFGSAAVSNALGGPLGAIDLRLPFLIYAGVNVFTFIILFSLKETPYEPHPETGQRISYREALATMLQAIKHNPNLRCIFLYSNLIPISTVIMGNVFMQPFVISIGLPISAMGVVAFGMQTVRMVGSYCADKLVKTFGEWRWLSLVPLMVVVGTVGMGVINAWPGILVFAMVGFGATATRPLIETLMMKNSPGTVRSTILSIDLTLFNLFVVLTEPWLGYVGEHMGIPAAYIVMGCFALISLGLVLFFWRRVWRGTEEVVA